MQRAVTELAYLRDAMTRGLIDDTGLARERDVLAIIRAVRGRAIVQPEGRAAYPSFRRQPAPISGYAPPSFPGPAGLGGNYPAPAPATQAAADHAAWGRLLPSIQRSIPAGNRRASRRPRWLCSLGSRRGLIRGGRCPANRAREHRSNLR